MQYDCLEKASAENCKYAAEQHSLVFLRKRKRCDIVADAVGAGKAAGGFFGGIFGGGKRYQKGESTAVTCPRSMRTERSSQRALASCGLASGRRR